MYNWLHAVVGVSKWNS